MGGTRFKAAFSPTKTLFVYILLSPCWTGPLLSHIGENVLSEVFQALFHAVLCWHLLVNSSGEAERASVQLFLSFL
jgi:hypothetical protein